MIIETDDGSTINTHRTPLAPCLVSELLELDRTGDTRLQWSKSNLGEVEAAKKRFAELKKKGYAAFRVKRDGGQGELIHDFDETAERIILMPPMVGG